MVFFLESSWYIYTEAKLRFEKRRVMDPRFLPDATGDKHARAYHPTICTIALMRRWADYFGCKCLSKQASWTKELKWECGKGHSFTMSPNFILENGWLCPKCSGEQKSG